MTAPNTKKWITVVGSLNMDLVVQCEQFPKPGETISANSYQQIPGGKGGNQAVSAALISHGTDAAVRMIGRVGEDNFGTSLTQSLESYGVHCDHVQRTQNCESGLAFITVQKDGQNSIAIVGGANAKVSESDIDSMRQLIESSQLVLLQLEIPLETVAKVIDLARASQVPVLLDPAPIPKEINNSLRSRLLAVDILTPNEHEASALSGIEIQNLQDVESAAKKLYDLGAKAVVITLGDKGAYLYDGKRAKLISAIPTEAVDTTAAGDAFAGAMAVRWVETQNLEEAVRWGNAAGAIAASRHGAQPSMGTRQEIEQRLRSN